MPGENLITCDFELMATDAFLPIRKLGYVLLTIHATDRPKDP